jgi:hypothetical protein
LGEAETPDVPSLLFAGVGDKDVTACLLVVVGWQAGCKLLAEDVPWTCPGLKVVD